MPALRKLVLHDGFSALQRAEIAEIVCARRAGRDRSARVSVLFNEPKLLKSITNASATLEIRSVSVLFNEPKLLKYEQAVYVERNCGGFSALQRAEIAEIRQWERHSEFALRIVFQCSSTSRNC